MKLSLSYTCAHMHIPLPNTHIHVYTCKHHDTAVAVCKEINLINLESERMKKKKKHFKQIELKSEQDSHLTKQTSKLTRRAEDHFILIKRIYNNSEHICTKH